MKSFVPLWIAAALLLGIGQLDAQTIIDTDTVYDTEDCFECSREEWFAVATMETTMP